MTKDEALDLALEALELSAVTVDSFGVQSKTQAAITAIKQARSAPVQEPFDHQQAANTALRESMNRSVAIAKNTVPTAYKRPQNCGTGYCSCIECVMEPAPVQEPVLQDIEQYRLQMAGISTAAIGYWKEGDGIHPDYDTPALRDVAKLYAKYDALYTAAQPTAEDSSVVAAPVQEPDHGDELTIAYMSGLHDGKKKRAWVGLTDEDKQHIEIMGGKSDVMLAEMVEAKLKEKNT
jgi:hypothetical protein